MANEIYRDSWWGNPTSTGWGNMYYDYIVSYYVRNYSDRVVADGGVVESLSCVDSNLSLVSNPIITLLGDAYATSLNGDVYTDAGATAYDELFFGDLTSDIVTTSDVDVNKTGVYSVFYNVTDPSGNYSAQVEREVYIKSILTDRFETRIASDGGVIESEVCIDSTDFGVLNWGYNFRVIDDSGVVESLECVII